MELGLPWTEKYRPKTLDDIAGHSETMKRLKAYIKNRNLPNLLFSGPAGTGKTTAAMAIAKELFGENYKPNFLELNASDERGINTVRDTIKGFARTLPFGGARFKIIFLDESDALTTEAQQALRRTMEVNSKICRFILSANYSSRIIPPIQSRCAVFRFNPLTADVVDARIKWVAEKEGVTLQPDALAAINYSAEGDLRTAINTLQSAASISNDITSENVYNVASRARPKEVQEMIKAALDCKFLDARKQLDTLMYRYGMSGEDVIKQIFREFIEMDIDDQTKIELVDKIGEYNFRLVEGANERIQLEALLAQFALYKNKIKTNSQ